MRMRLIPIVVLAISFSSAADAMDVATYLAKTESLRSKGVGAMFSSELKELQSEVRASAAALKQERLATLQRGRTPAYCPAGKVSLAPEEIFAAARAVPAHRRAITPLRDAIRSALARKYPCRG